VSSPDPDNPRQSDDQTAAQPESYDLAPEYPTPPAPVYPAQYPPPPASAYPPPGYQPGRQDQGQQHPGEQRWQPQPGYQPGPGQVGYQPAHPHPGSEQRSYPQPGPQQPSYPLPAPAPAAFEQSTYQPGYPQQPGQPRYRQPGYPQHPQPGYPQPGFSPGGQPHPAGGGLPTKKRTGLVIGLVVVGVIMLGCCGAGAVFGAPIFNQFPAKVTAPDDLAGLTKQQNAEVDQLGDQLGRELKRNAKVDDAVAGLYASPGDSSRLVLVVGASGFLLRPGKEVDNAFAGMSGSGLPVSTVTRYDAGALGGTVKCGSGTVSGLNLSVCAWGDHGSIGMGIFYGRAVTESADMFLKIREAMVDRG
jgi:hypothetical protein